jgi:hypothetical protein
MYPIVYAMFFAVVVPVVIFYMEMRIVGLTHRGFGESPEGTLVMASL